MYKWYQTTSSSRHIGFSFLYSLHESCWAGDPPRSVSDDQGLIEMLTHNIDYFKSKPDDLPKTTILLDNGYHPEKLTQALEAIYPEIMTKIQCWAGDPPRFELSAKPSKAEKEAKGQSGFLPVAARWVIERSNAWVERCKSLVKNFDRTLDRSNAKLELLFYSADAQAASRRHLKRSQMGSIDSIFM